MVLAQSAIWPRDNRGGRGRAWRDMTQTPLLALWKRFAAFALALSLICGVAVLSQRGAGAAGATVPSAFFGIHAGYTPGTIPTPPWAATAYRLHDAGPQWCVLNPAPGQYQWAALDAWLTQAQARHA